MIGPKAYIHLNRLSQNISNIRKSIGERNLMVVVKANGYGHGILNIANHLAKNSKMIFCVFSIGEAIQLRESRINNSILIFSRIQEEWIDLAIEYDFWINACHLDDLTLLDRIYRKKNKCPKIHLKFDTGMTRLGFDYRDQMKVYKFLLSHPHIPIEGIYSHFATADEGELSYAEKQLKLFEEILENGNKLGFYFKYIHCSNSGAILNLHSSLFNTVRVGMLAYGIAPSSEVEMKIPVEPAMSFCGPIINIRRVKKNTQISYGGVYATKKATNIGVIQAGFADGFPRPWYKNGYVSYKGEYYNIAGRVCMDQFMVDFGDLDPKLGDEVLIFGKMGNDELPIELIAEKINSTSYVLLTGIHGRTEYILTK